MKIFSTIKLDEKHCIVALWDSPQIPCRIRVFERATYAAKLGHPREFMGMHIAAEFTVEFE